jgi:sulfide:quinone oxidoreductase
MNISPISEEFSITQQIDYTDVEAIAGLGFTTIINNRPDNEQSGQPLSKALEKAAKKAKISYHHIPVVPGKATNDDVARFKAVLEECDGPVLAFCKSGMRAKSLHSACQKNPEQSLLAKLFGR